MAIKHAFTSAVSDGGDATLVRPSNWNADHVVTSLAVGVVGDAIAADANNYDPTGWNGTEPSQATMIRLEPTTNVTITGLTGGAAGRVAILYNNSADYLVVLPHESASSTAANRFEIPGFLSGLFLLPDTTATFVYDATDSRWELVSTTGICRVQDFLDFEDFAGSIGRMGSAVNGTGTSVQVSTYLQNTTEKPLGIWQADTGTTAAGRAHIGAGQATYCAAGYGQAFFLTRLAVEALSDGTETYQIFAGWHDAVGATNVTDGVYWCYRHTGSTAWQAAVAAAASRTETGIAAGPTVDTNYIWLGIHMNAGWTRANYVYSQDSATWTLAGTRTTGLPSGTQYMGMGCTINKTAGTTQRNLSVDLIAHSYFATRG
jgi:hypothetical protein